MLRHFIAAFSLVGIVLASALLLAHAGSSAGNGGKALLPLTVLQVPPKP